MLSTFYLLFIGSVWEAEARSGRPRLGLGDRGSCLVGLGSQSERLEELASGTRKSSLGGWEASGTRKISLGGWEASGTRRTI